MADRDSLRSLVRQHAETSALLGVPFVPAYRVASGGDAPALADEPGVSSRVSERARPASSAALPAVTAGTAVHIGEIGSKADRLDGLRARYIADEPHKVFETAHTSIVFGEGDPDARLMFVGEAPGADEDRLGRPFVGKSGQLLEKMIVAMGMSRDSVYIANVLKTRPPGNRTPTLEEARICAPYLYEQIRIIGPEVIVTLGKSAGQLLLGTSASMGSMRGRWDQFPPETPLAAVGAGFPVIAVMPTYHPAYLLRSYTAENRAAVWGDLRLVMDRLGLDG